MNKNTPKNRRIILISSYLLLFVVNGCFFSWSVLSIHFSNAFPEWTAAQMSLNATINIAASAFSGILVTRSLRRITCRRAVRVDGIIMAAGWLCMLALQWVPNILLLYTGFALIGFANGHYYVVIGKVLNSWYPERSGAVSGGMLLVTGVGSLLMGVAEDLLISAVGLFGLCAIFASSFFALLWTCGHWMTLPETQKLSADKMIPAERVLLKKALRTPVFWSFFLWLIFLASIGLLVINNAANIFAYYHAPATAGMFIMLFTGVGCQLMGLAIDRFNLRTSLMGASVFSLLTCILLLLGHWLNATALILLATLLCGVAYGSSTSAKMAGTAKLYGTESMTLFFGVFNLNVLIAPFMGTYVSGFLQMLGMGYYPSFLWMALLAIFSVIILLPSWRRLSAS